MADPWDDIAEDAEEENQGGMISAGGGTPMTGTSIKEAHPGPGGIYMIDGKPYAHLGEKHWFFQCLGCHIELSTKALSTFLTRLQELGYAVGHPTDPATKKADRNTLLAKAPAGEIHIVRGPNKTGIISYVLDYDQTKDSASDIAIKMAKTFRGTLKGFLVPFGIYTVADPVLVLIKDGQVIDPTLYKLGIVKR